MFAQEDEQSGYMDRFFAENSSTAISWIHDLGRGRYEAAACALLDEARLATNLETKHVSDVLVLNDGDDTQNISS
jgi:nuclear pore complex protein Nup133